MDPTNRHRWHCLMNAFGVEANPIVVDIGSNPLDTAPYAALLEEGLCHVCGFEPQIDAFEELQTEAGPNEKYLPWAIADGRPHKLRIYRQSGLTSLFELDPGSVTFLGRASGPATLIEEKPMETHRLDDLDDIHRIDLLKVDVQGAEAMIIKNGRSKLSEAMAVITELRFFPLYREEPGLHAQIAGLEGLGFRFHKMLFTKTQMIRNSQRTRLKRRQVASQALDGDVVFVRDLRDPSSVSSVQLKRLALLADSVFESYDLALHCLDILVERGDISPDWPAGYVSLLPETARVNA